MVYINYVEAKKYTISPPPPKKTYPLLTLSSEYLLFNLKTEKKSFDTLGCII